MWTWDLDFIGLLGEAAANTNRQLSHALWTCNIPKQPSTFPSCIFFTSYIFFPSHICLTSEPPWIPVMARHVMAMHPDIRSCPHHPFIPLCLYHDYPAACSQLILP